MVTSSYAPYTGGVERHLAGVCAELQQLGHHVDVLTFQREGLERNDSSHFSHRQKPPRESVEKGVRVFRLLGSGPTRNGQLQAAAWALQHARLMRTYDIIHGHDVVLKALQRFAPAARRYLTFHGFEGYPVTDESRERKLAMQATVQGAMCAGSFIERWFGVTCDVVEWGAYAPPAHVEPIPSDFCFVGRLSPDTGCEAYIEALASHLKQHPEKRAIICGDGPLKSRLQEQVEGLQISFLGMVANPADYTSGTQVVLTSGYLGILEALYAEKPVVSFADNPLKVDYLSSAPYAADIFITTTVDQLAAALETADHLSGEARRRSREFAEAATYEALTQCYLKLWENY